MTTTTTTTTRRDLLRLGAGAAAAMAGAAPKPPNFLVILADDMGYSDAGCYGGEVDTPNLDRLAQRGLRFTNAYSTARCGPSRSCLLTGLYAQQTASDSMTPGKIPDFTRYLPEYLKPLGYRSYHSGKWHMKHVTGEGGVGFDRSYNMLDGQRFFTQRRHELDGEPLPPPAPDSGYYSTTAIADYGVRFLEQHAQEYRDQPFFLYSAFHAPHWPLHAPPGDIARYADRFADGWDAARERKWKRMRRMGLVNCGLAPLEPGVWTNWNTPDDQLLAAIGPGEVMRAVPWASLNAEQKRFQRDKMAVHAAMITRMDAEIGRLLRQVEAMGAAQNTVVLFLSDNGASSEQMIRGDGHDRTAPLGSARTHLGIGPGWSHCANVPFRLHKSWVHEGGIASPLIVHWPAGIPARSQNTLRHDPCHFVDVLPTLVDLAGGARSVERTAGRSLAPAIAQTAGTVQRDELYFHHNRNRALRMGDWKLVAAGADGPWELYDLARDRCEQRNLVRDPKQTARIERMAIRWKALEDDFIRVREASPATTKKVLPGGGGSG